MQHSHSNLLLSKVKDKKSERDETSVWMENWSLAPWRLDQASLGLLAASNPPSSLPVLRRIISLSSNFVVWPTHWLSVAAHFLYRFNCVIPSQMKKSLVSTQ
jgi:hypothetical protein